MTKNRRHRAHSRTDYETVYLVGFSGTIRREFRILAKSQDEAERRAAERWDKTKARATRLLSGAVVDKDEMTYCIEEIDQ